MDRGSGDGAEDIQVGAQPPAPSGGAGWTPIDMSGPAARDMVQILVGMGISNVDAELAVQQTNGDSAEAAIEWVFQNRDRDELIGASERSSMVKDYKMVFVVNSSLSMTPGKMAAQVGHAAIALYQDLVSKQDIFGGPLLEWNENGSRKIVLTCDTDNELLRLEQVAKRRGLATTVIEDAGLTQIPSGSRTILAIFGVVNEVDEVTGTLKLYP